MPFVNVRIAGPATPEQKAEVMQGITEVLQRVLGKNPGTTNIVIEEVPIENWGVGGMPLEQWRKLKDG
ncbi:MAG: 4-oxalocrotonate tautomerase family protein [Sandaracinus sp.]|nr:4-oxalocrotonate tautomerase family protein [Sandaracinus sp.]MCB9619706.1 4-oxalocrotonate tautomerase family protein [Sandaracinus sp.]MCB9624043.1 4-oxalocrotonate tautomerase family protein [Sandaracinus sp.]